MSRLKSLNIWRSPNARALILVPKYFYIWGIDAINFFSKLVRLGLKIEKKLMLTVTVTEKS